jgi:hypothetical protein
MTNKKNKNNARTGGAALSSPNVDFINEGHAAQARYIAALANPFAAPAIPIPDSFLPAHCAKVGREITATITKMQLVFSKTQAEATGDYQVFFGWYNGNTDVGSYSTTSEVGARLVAAGISFEDGTAAADVGGFVSYKQLDQAYSATSGQTAETVDSDERLERNRGYGSLTYKLNRRQMLEFEGNGRVELHIDFDSPKSVIARFAAIVETDGKQGFDENVASQNEFVVTSSMDNVHAGVFSDIPHPRSNGHLMPVHADLTQNGGHHFKDVWHAAGNWVSAAAGWAWKHRNQVTSWANKAGQVYKDLSAFGGSITASMDGSILSLGARAAPLMLA